MKFSELLSHNTLPNYPFKATKTTAMKLLLRDYCKKIDSAILALKCSWPNII